MQYDTCYDSQLNTFMHYSLFHNMTVLTRRAFYRPATPVECASMHKTMHCFRLHVDFTKGTTKPHRPFVRVIAAISFVLAETSL